MKNNYKQGEIYWVDLNPSSGSVQNGLRPCLVLQTNAVSDLGKTTIIAPLTTRKLDNIYPYEVFIKASSKNKLQENSKVKLDQVRVIDKRKISKKIGILESELFDGVLVSLDIIFDRSRDFS